MGEDTITEPDEPTIFKKWVWCKIVGHKKKPINQGKRMGEEWVCERCNKHYRTPPAPLI